MLYLREETVAKHLPWQTLVRAIESAVRRADAVVPRRLSFELGSTTDTSPGRLLIMPSWNAETTIGIKTVTYRPDNAHLGLPSHGANYIVMNARSGVVEAVMEAHELTVRRTAAVSALAAKYLARRSSRHLLIVGSGPVARALASAHAASSTLENIEVFGRTQERVDAMIAALEREGIAATRCDSLEEAAKRADIICMATASTVPLIKGDWLRAGVHVDLIGSFTPTMREVDDVLLSRADDIWVDTLVAIQESGDLQGPIAAGVISEQDIAGDLHTLLREGVAKRRSESDITVFKAVGFGLCDLAAAQLVLAGAKAIGKAEA